MKNFTEKSFTYNERLPEFKEQCGEGDFFREVEEIIHKNLFVQTAVEDIKGIDEGVTLRHSLNVAESIAFIADEISLSLKERKLLIMAALVHDIGKKFLEKKLFDKEATITEVERIKIKEHVRFGFDYLLANNVFDLAEIVVRHHQCKDYPRDSKNEKRKKSNVYNFSKYFLEKRRCERRKEKPEFVWLARILSIADIIEATGDSNRPYNHYDEALVARKNELTPFDSEKEKEIIHLLEQRERYFKKDRDKYFVF